MNNLSGQLTTFCTVLAPLLPKCFSVETTFAWWWMNISEAGRTQVRQRIEQFSELYLLELFAQFPDRRLYYLSPHCSLVRVVNIIIVSFESFHIFRRPVCLWDPRLDFFVTWYLFHQFESNFVENASDFLVGFDCILKRSDRVSEVVLVEVSLNFFYATFVFDCIIFREFVQHVITTSPQAFRPKNLSCKLVNLYFLLWILSP